VLACHSEGPPFWKAARVKICVSLTFCHHLKQVFGSPAECQTQITRLTDRVREGTVTTSKIQTDFGVSGHVDVTVWTVITVADALQKVSTRRHLVRCDMVGEWTISHFARATQKPGRKYKYKLPFETSFQVESAPWISPRYEHTEH